jgi:eukaryotic-like serine/threonine-protein kinase
MNAALREVEFGNLARARLQSGSALALASSQDLQMQVTLVSGRAGDSVHVRKMADDMAKQFPLNTMLNRYWVPTLRAVAEIPTSPF